MKFNKRGFWSKIESFVSKENKFFKEKKMRLRKRMM